jgi:hypothetical protein
MAKQKRTARVVGEESAAAAPKHQPRRIGLAARLALCDFTYALSVNDTAEERDWLDAPRVGREKI